MERLTWERSLDGFTDVGLRDGVTEGDAICRLAAYERTGLEPCDYKVIKAATEQVEKAKEDLSKVNQAIELIGINHLCELVQAEQDGRLVMLPCKVGDTVYQTDGIRIYESKIRRILFDTDNIAFDERAIGKTVFLTREEAEAALAERRGGTDDQTQGGGET